MELQSVHGGSDRLLPIALLGARSAWESSRLVSHTGETASALIEQMGQGAILLDAAGRAIAVSEKARPYLGRALGVIGGRVRALTCRSADMNLQRAIACALRQEDSNVQIGSAVLVPQNAGYPLSIRCLLLPAPQDEWDPCAALAITELGTRYDRVAPNFERVFGLTPAEMRVAVGLLSGRSLAEIASESGTKLGTVRCQLKAIFAKTGVGRQRELIALLGQATVGS